MAIFSSQVVAIPLSLEVPWHSALHRHEVKATNKWTSRCWKVKVVGCRDDPATATKLVTFLGKGGSGKTISAILAAHHYAQIGLRTCLVLQSQEQTADIVLDRKLSCSPTSFLDGNLDVIRLESTKLLLEPLAEIKKADARLNFSQGILQEVKGEEISVLPGMDATLTLTAMERLLGFAGHNVRKTSKPKATYDIVVFDGSSSQETLRLVGAAERLRWYLQCARSLAEKTDTGRVSAPSILRLLEASITQDSASSNEKTIADLWDESDHILQTIAEAFADSKRFACYLVMEPSNPFSVKAALRHWGCAMQAGARVSGAVYAAAQPDNSVINMLKQQFSPLKIASLPFVSLAADTDWNKALAEANSEVKDLLTKDYSEKNPPPVQFNIKERTVTFFLPGFEKSEIKLSQWRGGSALLIEVGDQRRVVNLPMRLCGKVVGARFDDNSLIVSLKPR
eukprot:c27544_g1_i1 orf=290-1648(-)